MLSIIQFQNIILSQMGPFQSQQSKPPQNINQNAQPEQLTINHPKFNNFQVIKHPNEQEQGVIEITLPLANQTKFKNWSLKLKRFGEAQNIFLPLSQKFLKTQFCGSAGLCTAQYKYYPYLLSDEVVNRRSMEGKHFEEPELWYLIYCMLQAAKKFHEFGQKLGDIRPENIFISPDGQVAVATQYTWPGERTNYQKTALERQLTYLSPEQLKDISYGKLQQSTSFAINESFSIGLTCLDAATLSESIKLYENNNKFNYNKLQERLQQLQQSGVYSEPLILIIEGLCQVDAQKRTNCKELIDWLIKYEEEIIELTPFAVKELPDKLSNLRFQKTKAKKPQPFVNSINTGPINNSTLVKQQEVRYIEQQQPQQIIRQEEQKYIVQPNYYQSVPQNRTYVNSVSFNQMSGNQVQQNANIGGSVFHAPPPQMHNNFEVNQNVNPSTITFQNEGNKSHHNYVNGNSQLRSNLNLQQIDEQLQMSRKLFPS